MQSNFVFKVRKSKPKSNLKLSKPSYKVKPLKYALSELEANFVLCVSMRMMQTPPATVWNGCNVLNVVSGFIVCVYTRY